MKQYETLYVPIPIEERLPAPCKTALWQMDRESTYPGYWDEVEDRTWVYLEMDNGDRETFAFSDFTHWLEEKENLICLTIEELREMFKQARRKTERGDAPYIYPTVEEYLISKGINITENGK